MKFYVYTDSDTRLDFGSNKSMAIVTHGSLIRRERFSMLVEQVGSEYYVEATWFEGTQRYTETQFENLLKSL